jgi:hypothetical protein
MADEEDSDVFEKKYRELEDFSFILHRNDEILDFIALSGNNLLKDPSFY